MTKFDKDMFDKAIITFECCMLLGMAGVLVKTWKDEKNVDEVQRKIENVEIFQADTARNWKDERDVLLAEINDLQIRVQDLEKWKADHIELQAEEQVDTTSPAQPEFTTLTCKITAYCPCESCSEGYGNHTATGTTAQEGRTIAVDKNVIPLGSMVDIPGYGTFIAEDVGGGVRGNHIDMYFDSHDKVVMWQNPTLTVKVYKKG